MCFSVLHVHLASAQNKLVRDGTVRKYLIGMQKCTLYIGDCTQVTIITEHNFNNAAQKMGFPLYQKHKHFNVFQISHSTLSSVSSVKTTVRHIFLHQPLLLQSLTASVTRVTKIGKDYWLPKMSCHHSPHPHYHGELKVKHYVILLHEILQTLLHDVFSVGCWYSKFIHFFTPATYNAPFNGLPGQGSQRIRLNKQVRRMISKFGQSLNLFCTSAHYSLSYITLLSPHS